ncbi:hypothetical protein VYU27_007404, partial [Nannochloropsis oceanica]
MGKKGNSSSPSSAPTTVPASGSAAAGTGVDNKKKARGHRQRGAGAVMVDKGPVERNGVTLQTWQRLPSTLLQEHCQREKRPKANYYPAKIRPGDKGCKMQVVLPDPKKQREKDLRFEPTVCSDDSHGARENAALLALLHLTPTLPLERHLPEPYKSTWLHNTSAKTTQSKDRDKKRAGEEKKEKTLALPPSLPPPLPSAPGVPSSAASSSSSLQQPPPSSIATSSPSSSLASLASSLVSGEGRDVSSAPQSVVLKSAFR